MKMYLDKAKKRMKEINERKKQIKAMGVKDPYGKLSPNEPQPCTEEEVKALEEKLGRPLPSSYREFLLWMGKGVGKGTFMYGSDFFVWSWEQEQEMLELAREVLQDDQFPGELPEDAFVFFFHLSYTFCFFRLSEGEDPPVYLWFETYTEFKKINEHFSDWLLREIELHGEGVELYAPSSTEVKEGSSDVFRESEEKDGRN
jgi:hypothetical protein